MSRAFFTLFPMVSLMEENDKHMQVPKRKSENRVPKREIDRLITAEKYAELEKKLRYLKEVKRPREAEEVKRLAAMGDFSENAGYQLAKARLRGINRRIDETADLLKKAEIIQPSADASLIEVGHLVTLETTGKTRQYRILGSAETDPGADIISYRSPLGSALLGRSIGEMIEIETPKGTMQYRIIRIET